MKTLLLEIVRYFAKSFYEANRFSVAELADSQDMALYMYIFKFWKRTSDVIHFH